MEKSIYIGESFHHSFKVGHNNSSVYRIYILGKQDITCDMTYLLDTRGSDVSITVYILALPGTKIILRTQQVHTGAHTKSRMTVISAVGEHASVSYEGAITISKHAHGADAYEHNTSLLLGDHSEAVSKPILEIQTDDVACSHGSVTTTLSGDQLWYLESRGIPKKQGIGLMLHGLFGDMKHIPLHNRKDWQEGIRLIARDLPQNKTGSMIYFP